MEKSLLSQYTGLQLSTFWLYLDDNSGGRTWTAVDIKCNPSLLFVIEVTEGQCNEFQAQALEQTIRGLGRLTSGRYEKLKIVRNSNDSNRHRLYCQLLAKTEELVRPDNASDSKWGDDDHRRPFIVEDDLPLKSCNSLPLKSETASQPQPRNYYFYSSWVIKYESKVAIDQHAAPGSQNGRELSSSTDGSQEWD
ncbi:hypothetical protein NC653_005967 [Populus alba x Populus x berolinensis]|uniref:Uncharacterized protein n=1 Tax=Populus alba x Populus x berolinensis TaxID=444605 RepID=A0AAD6WBK4_9ROSI|nr:hypothetical protein NC653_005967 [Populus alba x Populus x berolinensis]